LRLNIFVALMFAELLNAVTEKKSVPLEAGLPLRTPVLGSMLKPDGGFVSAPNAQEYGGGGPSLMVKGSEYVAHVLASGNCAGVLICITPIDNLLVLETVVWVSVTFTVKKYVPAAVGSPINWPVSTLKLIPGGGVPDVRPQTYEPVPPLAITRALYL
jgi:hypothetical protein